jgi:hypothetical protein
MTQQPHALADETLPPPEDLRANRREKIIDKKMEAFVGAIHQLHEHKDSLSLEVEELKGTRQSLKTALQQTLHQDLERRVPFLAKALAETFHQQTSAFITNHLEGLRRLQQETEKTVSSLQGIADQAKHRTLLRGVALVVASCFCCFVIAAGLYYFFPSRYEVKYETTQEQFREMVYGRALMSAFKTLKPDAQNLILNALEATLKQMRSPKP